MKAYGWSRVFGLVILISILGGSSTISAEEEQQQVFRAGAATSNITPPLGELIVGGWSPIPATNIHDELHARCLVLDDGSTRLAFVICDNVGIPREVFDAAKQIVQAETDLLPEQVLMAATHTHSATTARGPSKVIVESEFTEYQTFLIRRIADSVRLALNNLEPAVIGWGKVDVPSQVFNRRWYMTDERQLRNPFGGVDKVRMNPPRGSSELLRPAGPIDPEVSFISVRSKEGRPISLLANYSLHYVGGVRRGDVSADYFGVFAGRIAELLDADGQDPPFVGILTNGTSGDVNNINFREKSPRLAPYKKMTQVAHLVADQVYTALQQINHQQWVPLKARLEDLTLQVRKPTPEMLTWLEEVTAKPDDAEGWHSREKIYADRIRRIIDAPDTVDVPLQTVRIGPLGIAAIPFEVFVEAGLEIKQKSPFPTTFTIELANGSFGYLPTPEQHELGGYETWLGTNYVEKQASAKIVETILREFGQMQ